MSHTPYLVLSCCISLDGYLDDGASSRLHLSNDLDFARVDAVRASCDAILVGANTIRKDDPRLLVRAPALRSARLKADRAPSPIKVTVTGTAELDPRAAFFTAGDAERLVYCSSAVAAGARRRFGAAVVVDAGSRPSMRGVVEDLADRGVERLLVEGGASVLTQLLTAGLADELQLAVAPVFVGDRRGRRFVEDGRFPWTSPRRAELVETRAIGDVALLRYALSHRCTGDRSPGTARHMASEAAR
jgi:5-amino-6-(5-phosphoribosylamino)uracil reductase